jgi:hypothetical protein
LIRSRPSDLINAKPEIIRKTVADIQEMKPDFIAPTHCTGFGAVVAFSKEMHYTRIPEQYLALPGLSIVGQVMPSIEYLEEVYDFRRQELCRPVY